MTSALLELSVILLAAAAASVIPLKVVAYILPVFGFTYSFAIFFYNPSVFAPVGVAPSEGVVPNTKA